MRYFKKLLLIIIKMISFYIKKLLQLLKQYSRISTLLFNFCLNYKSIKLKNNKKQLFFKYIITRLHRWRYKNAANEVLILKNIF